MIGLEWSFLALGLAFGCLVVEGAFNVIEIRKANKELRK